MTLRGETAGMQLPSMAAAADSDGLFVAARRQARRAITHFRSMLNATTPRTHPRAASAASAAAPLQPMAVRDDSAHDGYHASTSGSSSSSCCCSFASRFSATISSHRAPSSKQ